MILTCGAKERKGGSFRKEETCFWCFLGCYAEVRVRYRTEGNRGRAVKSVGREGRAGEGKGVKGGREEDEKRGGGQRRKRKGGKSKRAMTHSVYPSVLVFTDDGAGMAVSLFDDSSGMTATGGGADPCSRGGVNSRTRGDSP